jgi:hypothetical protein
MSVRVGYGQRRIKVTPEVIEAWLVYGNAVKTDLPDDARFVRLWQSDTQNAYLMVFESKEWDELAEGEEIPLITPTVERIDD